MVEEEIEERGITLGQVFRIIFSQKWLALIIAAIITVIGTLGLYFTGKAKQVYSVSFVLQLPNTGDATSTSYTYPDGDSFYFTDLISAENIKAVAARDEFKDIDVDKMVKKSDISILRTVDRVDEESQDGVYDLNYTIKVKAKYFEDEDAARDFVEALTSFPREHISSMDIDYDQSLTTSKGAITYDEQLNLLKSQAGYIQSIYSSLINAYGGEFVIDGGKTLTQHKDEIDSYLEKDLFTSLKGLADKNGYVKSKQAELKYKGDLESKNLALTRANNRLEELKKIQGSNSSTIIDGEIISLAGEIGNLRYEIDIIEKYLASLESAAQPPKDFIDEVNNVEKTVTAFTEGIKPVSSYVYGRVTKINYLSTKVVEIEGGTGLITAAVISLIVGLIIACIVAYIVGWSKLKKQGTTQSVQPIHSEAQLQAAIADEQLKEEKGDEK